NPGDVVVAVAFDTGYAPLFLAAGAVVTEIGGRLADVAVLAREFGRPAVVGAARAGSAIAEGDLIEVDGDRGLIRIIARRDAIGPPASTTS
ncbi:MAG: PEP-utilizing enzyme, partial [Bacteroidota bacterium]